MRIKDIELVKSQLKSFLPEYLEQHGRITGRDKKFQCVNPDGHKNGDKHPSAAFVPGTENTLFICFSCGVKGDIFHAAHYLEGMDLKAGFADTLIRLCERFNVRYEEDEDQEEIIRINTAAKDIARRLGHYGVVQDYMDRRGLSGAIDAFELGYAQWDWLVKEMPYPTDKVERVLDKFIFDKRLVIPIHDADGDVVGFAGRSLSDNNKRKYLNSRSSGVYLKNRILYNLHRIEGKKVYVVEGYPDVWRLHLSGYQAVAPFGTAFTREHLDILHERGIAQIVFCFDGDKAGLEASERAKKLIANDNRFRYAFKFMPYKIDPDELIRIQGASAFEAVEEEVIQEPHERILSLMIDRVVDLEAKLEDGIRDEGFQIEWPVFSSKMDGIQRGLHLVGGLSNVGKTSFMLQIFKQLAEHNAELIPVYFSIDDDWKTIYHRLLAAAANITIAQARDPVKHIRNNPKMSDMAREEYMERRKEGRLKLYHLFKRAPVLDIADAKRLDDFENTVRILKEHTGKELAIFIDNFHKIRDERFKSTNERFTRLSEELKRITVEYGLVTFATVELRKLNHKGRPSLDDIKESVDIIYDAQAIYMLHNDYHSKFGNTRFCFEWGGGVHPVIEMTVAKNKLTEFKGRIYYQFIPERAIYTECNMQDQIRFQKLAAEVGEDG